MMLAKWSVPKVLNWIGEDGGGGKERGAVSEAQAFFPIRMKEIENYSQISVPSLFKHL